MRTSVLYYGYFARARHSTDSAQFKRPCVLSLHFAVLKIPQVETLLLNKQNQQSSGSMPRCYMVKKGAPRHDAEPPPCSPPEATVAPPSYRPPDEHRANTETRHDAAAEYAELRSPLISERSAADTEAAHELLSLAAGVPPLPPAAMITVLQPPEPILPVYTYTLQPTTFYILTDEQPEPMYHAVQTVPLQQVEYTTIDHPHVNYVTYTEGLPPPPPLQYHPPPQVPDSITVIGSAPVSGTPGSLTTVSIEEVTTDSEPELLSVQVPVIAPVPQQFQAQPVEQLVEPPPAFDLDDDSDEGTLCIEERVTRKEKQGKYDCNECGKCYATSSNLSRHKQTHRSLDSNSAKKCGECGKAYVSMPALAMHVLTHRMGHVCGVCGKQFSRPWLLRGHLRSHTGEKPYNCADCGKAFADRSNLRAHLQTHSSDKKYECPRCKKNFALKSYLTKHQEAACTRGNEEGGAA